MRIEHVALNVSDPNSMANWHVQHLEDGSQLVMLRDPWGLALQLCKRAEPLL